MRCASLSSSETVKQCQSCLKVTVTEADTCYLVFRVDTVNINVTWRVLVCFFSASGSIVKPPSTLARSSSLCRSRRSVVPSSPQSQHALHSPDPDILSVSSCPALYRTEEEEEAIYFSADKQWYGDQQTALGTLDRIIETNSLELEVKPSQKLK